MHVIFTCALWKIKQQTLRIGRLHIFVILLVLSCTALHHYPAHWHENKIEVPANYFHEENALTLSISNDTKFLYCTVESTSLEKIEQIKHLGMSIWFSKGATPHKTHGIHYPLPYDDTQEQVALEGFSHEALVATDVAVVSPIHINASFFPEKMQYKIKLPLTDLQLTPEAIFTVSIASFALGKQEYLNSLTTAAEIERRLDAYKANPEYLYSKNELVPFFISFQLAKMPNKNP